MDHYTGGKWLIHGTKRRKDNQLLIDIDEIITCDNHHPTDARGRSYTHQPNHNSVAGGIMNSIIYTVWTMLCVYIKRQVTTPSVVTFLAEKLHCLKWQYILKCLHIYVVNINQLNECTFASTHQYDYKLLGDTICMEIICVHGNFQSMLKLEWLATKIVESTTG